MKLFISWSGDLSRALAVQLEEWLPMVVQQVRPWVSACHIQPGERWAAVLGRELEECEFAVLCLTDENRRSPWILFEAGAVARSLKAKVVPLLIDIDSADLDGPLAQFQAVSADRGGIERLVGQLYSSSETRLDARGRETVFGKLWPLFEDRLSNLFLKGAMLAARVETPQEIRANLEKALVGTQPLPIDLRRLDGLMQELRALRHDLAYLEAQEEELTRQDAPVSLYGRAIEPTQKRPAQADLAVTLVLESTFVKLEPYQRAALSRLVSSKGSRLTLSQPQIAPPEVITQLAQLGLVTQAPGGQVELSHELIAHYIHTSQGRQSPSG